MRDLAHFAMGLAVGAIIFGWHRRPPLLKRTPGKAKNDLEQHWASLNDIFDGQDDTVELTPAQQARLERALAEQLPDATTDPAYVDAVLHELETRVDHQFRAWFDNEIGGQR